MRVSLPPMLGRFSGRAAGVVLLSAVVRLVFFTGFHGFDDVFYIQRSYALSQGLFSLPITHWDARIAEVTGRRTPYQMMLGNPVVLALLRVVRPHERFGEYKAKSSPKTWTVYQLP